MPSGYRADQRRARLGTVTGGEARLPLGQAAAVIIGLSALCWAILIAVIMAPHVVL
jgi:hypothetical protein